MTRSVKGTVLDILTLVFYHVLVCFILAVNVKMSSTVPVSGFYYFLRRNPNKQPPSFLSSSLAGGVVAGGVEGSSSFFAGGACVAIVTNPDEIIPTSIP